MQPSPNCRDLGFFERLRSALALVLLAAFPLCAPVQAVTIDFSMATGIDNFLPYSEKGFTLKTLQGFAYTMGPLSGSPGQLLFEQHATIVRLTRADNGSFDLVGLTVTFNPSYRGSPANLAVLTSEGETWQVSTPGVHNFSGVRFEGLSWVDLSLLSSTDDRTGLRIDDIVVQNSAPAHLPDAGSTGWLLSGVLGFLGVSRQYLLRARDRVSGSRP